MSKREFIETEEGFGWMENPESLDGFKERMKLEGFVPIPGDHAPPQEGYDYEFFGPLCYYRPRLLNRDSRFSKRRTL